ncbi:SMP-30/gluconolactonase/LRE family protein [Microbacterium sp. 2FI]|uniref:SMP-30/gluconolactonase/LRE family protein n=1 Tax=Microbacterium sp. 2FI TaxID=2502193 RepID=UPI0010F5100C|nr:SMP-30/gluconolactonase/LRE family protein [Microbacterium sp. 2FI]
MSEQISVAVSRRAECGEGPIWDAAAGAVHWVDIIPGEILITDFATGQTRVTAYPEMVGAVAPRVGGGVVAAVTSGFVGLDAGGAADRRVDILPEGIRMNDAKTDPSGRFWAGSCEMSFADGLGGLWRLDENWNATLVLPHLTQPNGLGWSPDGSVFYLVETQARQILRFDFDLESSTITSEGSVLVDADVFPDGFPDGLAVDTRGHLWVAEFAGSAVHEFSPDGDRLRTVAIPTLQTTSCNFVGPELDELWVTSAAWQLDPEEDADAGSIFRVEGLGAVGLATAAFRG